MNIYEIITSRIIEQMENGIIPWHKPWVGCGNDVAVSHATGKEYSLLNQMLLGNVGEYLTAKDIRKEHGSIREGEKPSIVVFWKWLEKLDEETGETKEIPYLRYYNVYHITQCDGIKPKYTKEVEYPNTAIANAKAEKVISEYTARSGVHVSYVEGDRAFYSPATDVVTIPNIFQFDETAEFYSTVFHELTHSTGHVTRLNRLNKNAHFGSNDYSKEELIAEIGAASLVNNVGLETEKSFRNSAAYIQNWLQVLKNDSRLIVSAAGKAEKAVNMILGI